MRDMALLASKILPIPDADLLRGAGGVPIVAAERFAGRGGLEGAARYAGAHRFRPGSGTCGPADALAAIDHGVEEDVERHGRAIVLGTALAVHLGDDPEAEPLACAAGAFARVEAALPA